MRNFAIHLAVVCASLAAPARAEMPSWWVALHGSYLEDQAAIPTLEPAPAPCVKPSSFYAAGVSLNKAAKPNIAGILAVGVPLTCQSNPFQVYSYTEHNLIPVGSGKDLTFRDTTTTGFATPLKEAGPIHIYAFGNIGLATNGQTAELAGAYGVLAVFPLWKNSGWRGLLGAQKVAGSNVYSALVGRAW